MWVRAILRDLVPNTSCMPGGVPGSSGAELNRLLALPFGCSHCSVSFIFKFFGTETFKRAVLASAWIRATAGKVGEDSQHRPMFSGQTRKQGRELPEAWVLNFLRTREAEGRPFPYRLLPHHSSLPFCLSSAHSGFRLGDWTVKWMVKKGKNAVA